jgi:hypothetical protein
LAEIRARRDAYQLDEHVDDSSGGGLSTTQPATVIWQSTTCATSDDFIARASDITAECCDEPTEDCADGHPSICNAGCAAVLLPVRASCAAGFLSTGENLKPLRDALDVGAAACSCTSNDALELHRLAVQTACCQKDACPDGDLPTTCSPGGACAKVLMAMQVACAPFLVGQGTLLTSLKNKLDDTVDVCNACVGVDCGAHGSCNGGDCVCAEGYFSSMPTAISKGGCILSSPCEDPVHVDCGSHGQCDVATGACTCHDGYRGPNCLGAPLQCCSAYCNADGACEMADLDQVRPSSECPYDGSAGDKDCMQRYGTCACSKCPNCVSQLAGLGISMSRCIDDWGGCGRGNAVLPPLCDQSC